MYLQRRILFYMADAFIFAYAYLTKKKFVFVPTKSAYKYTQRMKKYVHVDLW